MYGISAGAVTSSVHLSLQEDGNLVLYGSSGALWNSQTNEYGIKNSRVSDLGYDGNSEFTGGSLPHNILQPYLVVYHWRRTL